MPDRIGLRIDDPCPGDSVLASSRPSLFGRFDSKSAEPGAQVTVCVDGERIAPVVKQTPTGDQTPDGLYTHWLVVHLYAFLDRFDGARHEIVLEVSVDGKTETRRLEPVWHRDSFIALASVDTTNTCNLRCRFCNEDQNWKLVVMDPAEFERLGEELFPAVSSTILLSCGDEPFMNKRFHEYCAAVPAAEKQKSFFTSNMTVPLTDEQLAGIADCRLSSINVSLDSSDPAIFESMRVNGKFDVFVDNVTRLAAMLEAKDNEILRFIAVITRENLRGLPDTVEWAMQFDPKEFEFRTLSFSHHWAESGWRIAEGAIDDDELRWLRLRVDEICRAHGRPYLFEVDPLGTPEGYRDPAVFPTRQPLKPAIRAGATAEERQANFEAENRARLAAIATLDADEANSLLETYWVRVIATGRVVFNNRFPMGYVEDHAHLGELAFDHACALARRIREQSRLD